MYIIVVCVPFRNIRTRELNGLGFLEIYKKVYMQYYTVPQKVILSPEMYSDLDTAKDCNRYCDLGYDVSPYACCLEGLRSMDSLHLN